MSHPRDFKSADSLLAAFIPTAAQSAEVPGRSARTPARPRPRALESPTEETTTFLTSPTATYSTGDELPQLTRKRRQMSQRDLKPIPLAAEAAPSQLDSWERSGVSGWGMEEVLAWVMAVARRAAVAPEDLCLHRFPHKGQHLLEMSQTELMELSPRLGAELFQDLLRLQAHEASAKAQASSAMPTLLMPRMPPSSSLSLPLAAQEGSEEPPPLKRSLHSLPLHVATVPPALGATFPDLTAPHSQQHLLAYLTGLRAQLPHQGPSFLDSILNTTAGVPDEASPQPPAPQTAQAPPSMARMSEAGAMGGAAESGGSGGEGGGGGGAGRSCTLQPPPDRKPTLEELLVAAEQSRPGRSRKAQLLGRWEQETASPDIESQAAAINSSIFGQIAPPSVSQEYQRALQRAQAAVLPVDDMPSTSRRDTPGADSGDSLDKEEQAFRANFPPRNKRAHGKKHVLWQFILQCLGDSRACPSVVRWEDRQRGIFRIVSSMDLAQLWGQRKNRNSSMSYEKLSRAMRAYYKEGILFPGPRSGRFPKKLVYQFGPNAHGWKEVAAGTRSTSISE